MTIWTHTFTVTLPHPETETYEEDFECTFELSAGEPMTYDHPGCPASCEMISAYASIYGPVNRISEIPEEEIERLEIKADEMAAEDFAQDFDEPEFCHPEND